MKRTSRVMNATGIQDLYVRVFVNIHCTFGWIGIRSQVKLCSLDDLSAHIKLPLEVALRGL